MSHPDWEMVAKLMNGVEDKLVNGETLAIKNYEFRGGCLIYDRLDILADCIAFSKKHGHKGVSTIGFASDNCLIKIVK